MKVLNEHSREKNRMDDEYGEGCKNGKLKGWERGVCKNCGGRLNYRDSKNAILNEAKLSLKSEKENNGQTYDI